MSFLSRLSRFTGKTSSLDQEWSAATNTCLFSFTDKNGRTMFVSDADCVAKLVEGEQGEIKAYDVFAPDAFINKVSGSVSSPAGSKKLVAYIDGSYVQHQGSHASAYGIWCYCGDAQAEYANAVATTLSRSALWAASSPQRSSP